MENEADGRRSWPLAVIMERKALQNRWASEQWEVLGIVRDPDPVPGAPRVIVHTDRCTRTLYPGYRLVLTRDEAEGYYLNLTSPEPKVFVLWRWIEDVAQPQPQRITVSYGEGTRWADSGEQVDGVAIPPELLPWIAAFVEKHYEPEPPKKKRYASNKDRGRMGQV
jgi:hypothetical protein